MSGDKASASGRSKDRFPEGAGDGRLERGSGVVAAVGN